MTFLFVSQFSFAQDDGGGEGRDIFVGLTPSTSALIGVQGGMLSSGKGILGGGDFIDALGFFLTARFNSRDIISHDRLSITLNVAPQLTKYLSVYLGGGYGTYSYPYKEPTLQPDEEYSGFEAEGGLQIKFFNFTISGGVSILDFNQTDYTVGVGYTF